MPPSDGGGGWPQETLHMCYLAERDRFALKGVDINKGESFIYV